MAERSADFLPSSIDTKTRLSSLTPEALESLQNVFHDRLYKKWLRSNGWLNIFLGGVTLWLGLSGLPELSFPELVQTLIGAFTIGHSLWAVVSPGISAFLRFAILFLGSGIWNMLMAISGDFTGAALMVGLLGIAQVWWAFQFYGAYRRYRQMEIPELQADVVRFYDEAWQAITTGELRRDPANIQLWIGRARWQGLLLADRAVFAFKGGKLLIIQDKDDANFKSNGSKPLRKRRIYGQIKLDAVFERAMMTQDSFKKYAAWKGEEAILAAAMPSLWERLPRFIRMVLMIIFGLFLLYIAFLIIGLLGLSIQYG